MTKAQIEDMISAELHGCKVCTTWKLWHFHKDQLEALREPVSALQDPALSDMLNDALRECHEVWRRGMHGLEHKD